MNTFNYLQPRKLNHISKIRKLVESKFSRYRISAFRYPEGVTIRILDKSRYISEVWEVSWIKEEPFLDPILVTLGE